MSDGSDPATALTNWAHAIEAIAERRDRAAFSALFQHFAPRVKTFMRRSGASDASAEELAQETLLTVWRKAEQFDPASGGAAAWIFTIARNLRIDALRRERPTETLDEAMAESLAADEPGPDAVLATREAERALRAALAGLSEDQAALLRLSFFEDKSHGAISVELGLPLGTVKSRIRKAMIKLRTLLDDEQGGAA